jgi:hypothetical protein
MAAPLADPTVLGVGGEVEPRWLSEAPPWFPAEFGWVVGCSYTGQPSTPAPVRNLMAGNMVVRKDVFEGLGGYRAGHGNVQLTADAGRRHRFVTRQSGCEETDLCIRALAAWPGHTWQYEPAVRIDHCVPKSRTTLRYFLARCNDEGLAKARVVVEFAGAKDGLSTERRYVTRVLPRAVVRGMFQMLRGDWWGAARAVAVITGFSVTTLAYARARAQLRLSRPPYHRSVPS